MFETFSDWMKQSHETHDEKVPQKKGEISKVSRANGNFEKVG